MSGMRKGVDMKALKEVSHSASVFLTVASATIA